MKRHSILAAILLLGGCDLFAGEKDIVIEATGRVVNAETGEPIEGLSAVIAEVPSSIGATVVRASTQTDTEGRFSLRYQRPAYTGAAPRSTYEVAVNNSPYDSRYTSLVRYFDPPPDVHVDFGVIELEQTGAP